MSTSLKIYQIDAFTDKVFGGNPAAVLVLKERMDDALMQNIAAENNLAETAFVVATNDAYEIRWFTPRVEVDLCGHATLAAAHVLFNYYDHPSDQINFQSRTRGALSVSRNNDLLSLNFPADDYQKVSAPDLLILALGKAPIETFKGKSDYVLVYASQQDIENSSPNFNKLEQVEGRGFIITAPGDEVDFVSRFYAPQVGINEDPVTGSAHTTLTPIWSKKLGKTVLSARQLSTRKGVLACELIGDRVIITGKAVTYMVGEIKI